MTEADGSEYNEGQTRFKTNLREWVNFLRQKRENENCKQIGEVAWRESAAQRTSIAPRTRTSSDQTPRGWVIDPCALRAGAMWTFAIVVER